MLRYLINECMQGPDLIKDDVKRVHRRTQTLFTEKSRMYIKRLIINDFRNMDYAEIEPCQGFNFLCGPNGSGKTSVIEAIHYLSLARSFRTSSYQYLIKQGRPCFNIFALVQEDEEGVDTTIGMSRSRGENAVIKINSDQVSRMIDLIDLICVQIIHPQGVELITKEAEGRRSFIDWGVYYTDPEFKNLWLQYRKILKQRNSLLRKEMLKRKGVSRTLADMEFNAFDPYQANQISNVQGHSSQLVSPSGRPLNDKLPVGQSNSNIHEQDLTEQYHESSEDDVLHDDLDMQALSQGAQFGVAKSADNAHDGLIQAVPGGFFASNHNAFDEVTLWDEQLALLCEQITEKRVEYLSRLQVILQEIIGRFLPNFKIKFELNPGWEKGLNLRSVLAQNLEKDKALGYTFYGCHRADLKIKNNTVSAGATLSRGQLKMLVYALRLAQGMLLKEHSNRSCIYLIDDLNSELDDNSQRELLNTLLQCRHQVFISNIRQELLLPKDRSDYKVFALDRGMVSLAASDN